MTNEYTDATQFIDLTAQQRSIRPALDAAIRKVLDHGQYIMGCLLYTSDAADE